MSASQSGREGGSPAPRLEGRSGSDDAPEAHNLWRLGNLVSRAGARLALGPHGAPQRIVGKPGLGVRCVSDQPWITAAETCELVIALDACGMRAQALEVFASVQLLRHPDGSYWTGWQFDNQAPFPRERSSWTAAAVVLAADALAGFSGGAGIFRDAGQSSADPVAGPL